MPEIQVQCVVVLYQNTLAESKTVQSFLACCREFPGLAIQFPVLLYDNSPTAQRVEANDFPVASSIEYYHDAANGGLPAAYNRGLAMASSRQIEWLLLLDQDTAVTAELFDSLLREIGRPTPRDVVAMVPKLVQEKEVISPQYVGAVHNVSVPLNFVGASAKRLTALNSAACLRVGAVVEVGGFPAEYWLDYLDHVMFYRLQARGGRVMVLDARIEHRLSYLNVATEMSLERYANMLAAEWKFVRETGTGGGALLHRLRLLKRAFGLYRRVNDSRYGSKTLGAVFR